MVVIGTVYDKSVNEKMFYVREVDRYTHSTSTSLDVQWKDNVFTLTAVVSNMLGKGYVKFYKDGEEIGEQYVSKTATLLYPSTSTEGVFVARFMGNSDCLKSESPETLVGKTSTVLTVVNNSSSNKYVGDTVTVTVTLKDEADNVMASASISDGVTTKTTNSNGVATFTYTNSSPISYSKTYSYGGTDLFDKCTGVTNWTVIQVPTYITLTPAKTTAYVDDAVSIVATVYDARDDSTIQGASVDMNGQEETTSTSGEVSAYLSTTTAGTYSYYAQAFKDSTDKYAESTVESINYTVVKYTSSLSGSLDQTVYYVDDTVNVTVTLKDNRGYVISGVSVSDGVTSKTTSSDGVCTFSYTHNSAGAVSKTYTFEDTIKYTGCTTTVDYNVIKYDTNLSAYAGAESYVIGQTATVGCYLKDENNNPISNVSVSIGGVSVTTGADGKASTTFECSETGAFNKTITYAGDYKYDSSETSASYNVVDKTVVTMNVTSPSTLYVDDACEVTVKLLADDNPLSGAVVSDGTSTETTNNNGECSFSYSTSSNGDVNKTYSYNGDTTHAPVSKSVAWTIIKYNSVLTLTADKTSCFVDDTVTLTGLLKDNLGNPVSGVSLTAPNDSTVTTDSNGKFTTTYQNTSSGTVNKTYTFAGNEKYEGCSGSTTWTVNGYETVLTVTSDKTSYNVGETATVTATLKTNTGNPINDITMYIGDVEVTTNSNGVASTTFTCDTIGGITKEASYSGSSKYGSAMSNVKYTVFTDTVLTLTTDKSSYDIGENTLLTATLKTSNGTVIPNVNIQCGDTTQSTNSEGVATFTLSNTIGGEKNYSASFNATGFYNECSGSVTCRVRYNPSVDVSVSNSNPTVGDTVTVTVTVKNEQGGFDPDVPCMVGFNNSAKIVDDNGGVGTFTVTSNTAGEVEYDVYVVNSDWYTPYNGSVTITWSETVIVPELTISGDSLVGETGDVLSVALASNLDSGASVSLVDVSDNTLATATTGADGSATFNYTCTGVGDKNVYAKYMNGSDVFNSNILTLEVCLYYDSAKTNKLSNYTINPNISCTWDENGCYTFEHLENDNWRDSYLKNHTIPDSVIIEFDARFNTSGAWWHCLCVGLVKKDDTTCGVAVEFSHIPGYIYGGTCQYTEYGWQQRQSKLMNGDENDWYHFKGIITTSQMQVESYNMEGVLLHTTSLNDFTLNEKENLFCIGMGDNSNNNVSIKKIKIKPYTEE